MDTIKAHKLFTLFIASFVIFNVLFFVREPVVDWWYDRIDVYSQCEAQLPENSTSYALQNCDLDSISRLDNTVTGVLALSGMTSSIAGSILLIRLVERLWNKKSKKPAPRRPRQSL